MRLHSGRAGSQPTESRLMAKILVVDDAPLNVKMLVDILGSVAKFDFSRKIEFLVSIDSMTYRIPNSSKTNFATEPH